MTNDTCNETTGCSYSWTVELPWPAKELSPNARHHWAAAAKAKKAYRAKCRLLGEAQALWQVKDAPGPITVGVTFFAPDNRPRDLDNMLASMKSGLDGLADAMGVDDSGWSFRVIKAKQIVPGGLVVVEVIA